MKTSLVLFVTTALSLTACSSTYPASIEDSTAVVSEAVLTHVSVTSVTPVLRLCNVPEKFAATLVDSGIAYGESRIRVINECRNNELIPTISVRSVPTTIRLDSIVFLSKKANVYFIGRTYGFEWYQRISLMKDGNLWTPVESSLFWFGVE